MMDLFHTTFTALTCSCISSKFKGLVRPRTKCVYLWNPRSVCWQYHPHFRWLDKDRIFIYGWTIILDCVIKYWITTSARRYWCIAERAQRWDQSLINPCNQLMLTQLFSFSGNNCLCLQGVHVISSFSSSHVIININITVVVFCLLVKNK